MVQTLPEQLRDDIRRATDVFTAYVGRVVSNTASAGDTFNVLTAFGSSKPNQINFGQDVEVLAGLVKAVQSPRGTGTPADLPSRPVSALSLQWSTRSVYATSGGDGDLAAGLLYEEAIHSRTPFAFEDQTNGTGGSSDGLTAVHQRALSPETIEVESTTEFDEGTDISAHVQVESVPSFDIQLISQIWLWTRER